MAELVDLSADKQACLPTGRRASFRVEKKNLHKARMAELVDALASGASWH